MVPQEKVKEFLEEVAHEYPAMAIKRLEKGMLVKKSMGLSYEIDDPEVYRRFGDPSKGGFPYNEIHKALEPSMSKTLELFKGSNGVIQFSIVLEAGAGECLEKAIITQLYLQEISDSFMIPGILTLDDDFANDHAFNIAIATKGATKGKPYLIDTHNPMYKSGQNIHPYIAEIELIEKGDFMLPKEWRAERTYSLSRGIDLAP